jgi:hypothetical protein
VAGRARRQAGPQPLAEGEAHLADRGGVRIDPIEVGVAGVRVVVIDVDEEGPGQALHAGAGDVGALEEDDGVVAAALDLADPDAVRVGKP